MSSEHIIVPVRTYVVIFVSLLVLTAVTYVVATQDFGWMNTPIALAVALGKASLVVIYFMHVRYSARLVWVIVGSALFWMAILFAFTFADYLTRGRLSTGI